MNLNDLKPGAMIQMTFDVDGFTLKARPNAKYGTPRKVLSVKIEGNPDDAADDVVYALVTYESGTDYGTVQTCIVRGEEIYRIAE